jgi:hypothetical protein
MAKTAFVVAFTAAAFTLASTGFAQHGPTPRPAERPPEYGCRLLDLTTSPDTVKAGDRIDAFQLKYTCQAKTRPVDIEIRIERLSGVAPELVKVATDIVLDKGEHTLRLAGGGPAQGGRYITVLKASAPAGKTEIMRRVDAAVCRGWEIKYVENVKEVSLGDCKVQLHTDPGVFKTGERIKAFLLVTSCRWPRTKKDITISWKAQWDHQEQIVTTASDASIPSGRNTMRLADGGIGREGYYLLKIQDLNIWSAFKTNCTAWTLSQK